jgi:hypothetical protein
MFVILKLLYGTQKKRERKKECRALVLSYKMWTDDIRMYIESADKTGCGR